ncbi:MAG: rhodanese-like domain-containing protein [Candidatus Dormibacteria bacterium]
MILEQYYLGCLSQASYLVADEASGRAVVVDPRRDIDEYLREAEARHLQIELVILTHVHADFVPGHAELAAATGAEVAMGVEAPVTFPIRRLHDGERIALGDAESGVALEILATPGHTPESITVAVRARAADAQPVAVLTGDTLFLGDVGRPDLLGSAGRTAEDMARQLYRSLRARLLPLPDEVLVLPGHGAGSACGKALSSATRSTMGQQRRENDALQPMEEDQFVAAVTEGLGEPPAYFAAEVAINRAGHTPLSPVPLTELDVDAAQRFAEGGGLLLDVRDAQEFAAGHLRGAVNVGLSGRFAEFAAAVHEPGQPVVIAGSREEVEEARLRLARVGLDDVAGALVDPGSALATHAGLSVASSRLTSAVARQRVREVPGLQIVDVRGPGEHAEGSLPGSTNLLLPRLLGRLGELDRHRPVLVHCAGGYRSSAAASLLVAHGFDDVSDLIGGYGAWTEAGLDLPGH